MDGVQKEEAYHFIGVRHARGLTQVHHRGRDCGQREVEDMEAASQHLNCILEHLAFPDCGGLLCEAPYE